MGSFTANASVSAYLQYDDYECVSDHLVFETSMGYVTAEWYSGTLHSGNYFYGDFNSYGFKDVYSSQEDAENRENSSGRIWIDDYMMSGSSAIEWCQDE